MVKAWGLETSRGTVVKLQCEVIESMQKRCEELKNRCEVLEAKVKPQVPRLEIGSLME